jgi:Outer membrane protein beta-barrel domain
MSKYKILLASFIFLSLAITAQAQFRSILKSIDELEVIGGPGLVSLHGSSSLEEYKKSKIGYIVGIGSYWNIKKRFSGAMKFIFERKGINTLIQGKYFDHTTQQLENGEAEYKLNFDYLSLPITIRYFLDSKKLFYAEAGVYASYLLKCRIEVEYSWQQAHDYSDMTDRYYDFDGGITLALGYKFKVTDNASIGFWMSTNYGLFNVGRQQLNPIADNVRHKTLSIGVGISRMRSVKLN